MTTMAIYDTYWKDTYGIIKTNTRIKMAKVRNRKNKISQTAVNSEISEDMRQTFIFLA